MDALQCMDSPASVCLDSRPSLKQIFRRPFQQSRGRARAKTTATASHVSASASTLRRNVLLAGAPPPLARLRSHVTCFGALHAPVTDASCTEPDLRCAGAALLAAPLVPHAANAGVLKKENLSGFQRADQRSAFQVWLPKS